MYTKEQLMAMPLHRIRLLDIKTREDEALIQEVVSLKMSQQPPETPVQRIDVPDIKTKEDEEKWQKIIDERNAKLKPQTSLDTVTNPTSTLTNVTDGSVPVTPEPTVPVEVQIENKQEELNSIKEEINNTPVTCDICQKQIKNERGLRMHKGRFHKELK